MLNLFRHTVNEFFAECLVVSISSRINFEFQNLSFCYRESIILLKTTKFSNCSISLHCLTNNATRRQNRSKLGRLLFFDHFKSLKNQKRLFMTHPTFDQRTSEYVGIRIDVTTLLNYTEKILNEENNEVFSINFYFPIEENL